MAPKKKSAKDSSDKKKRMMSLEIKHEIIEKHEQGVRVVDLARQYERSTSTICTILKQKDSIKAVKPAKGITIISKRRTSVHEETEDMLLVWLKDKELAGNTVTEGIICEKARTIYDDLIKQTGTSADDAPGEVFKASHGWFDNFKKRSGLRPLFEVKVHLRKPVYLFTFPFIVFIIAYTEHYYVLNILCIEFSC